MRSLPRGAVPVSYGAEQGERVSRRVKPGVLIYTDASRPETVYLTRGSWQQVKIPGATPVLVVDVDPNDVFPVSFVYGDVICQGSVGMLHYDRGVKTSC